MGQDLRQVPLDDLRVEDGPRPAKPDLGEVAPQDRLPGRHLAAIHRHYLADIGRIEAVLRRIEAGDAPPEELRQIVLNAEMTQNFRAFGTICGQECRVLKMHHDIEEHSIFPELSARGSAEVRAVVDRLRAEHEVVHELIERLAAKADDLQGAPDAAQFEEAGAIFDRLVAVVRSHFGWEESVLDEALGKLGVRI